MNCLNYLYSMLFATPWTLSIVTVLYIVIIIISSILQYATTSTMMINISIYSRIWTTIVIVYYLILHTIYNEKNKELSEINRKLNIFFFQKDFFFTNRYWISQKTSKRIKKHTCSKELLEQEEIALKEVLDTLPPNARVIAATHSFFAIMIRKTAFRRVLKHKKATYKKNVKSLYKGITAQCSNCRVCKNKEECKYHKTSKKIKFTGYMWGKETHDSNLATKDMENIELEKKLTKEMEVLANILEIEIPQLILMDCLYESNGMIKGQKRMNSAIIPEDASFCDGFYRDSTIFLTKKCAKIDWSLEKKDYEESYFEEMKFNLAHEMRHAWQKKYHSETYYEHNATKLEVVMDKAEIDADAFALLYTFSKNSDVAEENIPHLTEQLCIADMLDQGKRWEKAKALCKKYDFADYEKVLAVKESKPWKVLHDSVLSKLTSIRE